jgi:hypothetical protein
VTGLSELGGGVNLQLELAKLNELNQSHQQALQQLQQQHNQQLIQAMQVFSRADISDGVVVRRPACAYAAATV